MTSKTTDTDEIWLEEAWHKEEGHALTIRANEKLEDFKSDFQHLQVYNTDFFGKVLLLDGIIQLTEYDEFAYHEMMAHVPMAYFSRAEYALVVGGGDGGAVRELAKYPFLKKIILCDIDPAVTQVSRKHFPGLSAGLDDPRVEVLHEDGFKFLRETDLRFDVIITDSTDPIGPAEKLFTADYYRLIGTRLTDQGFGISQCESIFFERDLIGRLLGELSGLFAYRDYYFTLVPTYPSGTIGFSIFSKGTDPRQFRLYDHRIPDLQYYSLEAHEGAFKLPAFARRFAPISSPKD